MSTGSKLERVLSVALTLATLAVAAVVVEGRVRPRQSGSPDGRVEFIENWAAVSNGALLPLGSSSAPVKIVTFTDFECPYCKLIDSVLTELEARFPGQIARSIVHFPLPMHRDAVPAAVAQECADAQGRTAAMHSVLYSGQRDFGRRPWVAYAIEAGVPDSAAFESCVLAPGSLSRVSRGRLLADSLRLTGTPVVVINGWLFDPSPAGRIERAVQSAAQGRSPK